MSLLKAKVFVRLGTLTLITAITSCGKSDRHSNFTSITDPDYQGKKYYLGWGAAKGSDPSNMHNEVKYDVLHTHDLFVKNIGGNYIGTKITGSEVNGTKIKSNWNDLQQKIKPEDMYIQYSSGHGMSTGLEIGVTYAEMRDHALALNAKETIIFTMACYSGNLVDSFDRAKEKWKDFASKGKTLLVVASSQSNETSSIGPGTDVDQPNSPYGSAGSAFGNALWKGIIGYADGGVDGVKDKKITLDELLKYVRKRTEAIGDHTPKYTGVYDPKLVMTLVPTRGQLEQLLGNTAEGQAELEQILNDNVL